MADEALASLDISMRSQIINLCLSYRKKSISFIYITHHLGMMKHVSDQIIVMQTAKLGTRQHRL